MSTKNLTPEFEIGQEVHYKGDPEGINGEIVSFRVTLEGVTYQITSQDVDVTARKMIEGVKHVDQKELEAVKSTKNQKE